MLGEKCMLRFAVRTIAAFALLAATTSALAQPAEIASSDSQPFARATERVAPNVSLIFQSKTSIVPPFEGNCVVIEQSNGLVVVDAGGSPLSGRAIVEQIRKISRLPVRYLIYTHYHGDHNLGAGEILKAWPGLRIISTAKTRANMVGPPMAYIANYASGNAEGAEAARKAAADPATSETARRGWQVMAARGPAMVAAYQNLKAWPADITFDDKLDLPDAVAPVSIRFIGRANTDGDAIVWLPQQRVVVTGDIVVAPSPYASASYSAEWLQALDRIRALNFATLIPGHGPVMHDRAYLDRLSAAITEIRSQVLPLALAGASLDEVRKQVSFSALRTSFTGDDGWGRIAFNSFFLRALVSNIWKEARGEPIVQGVDGG